MERFALLRPALEEGVPQTEVTRMHKLPPRTVQRLLTQIERLLQINELRTVTKAVVETA